jgi:hypothetical protein
LTWWVFLLAATSSFTIGWVAHGWQCSKRRDCPRYAEYALAKWKREVGEQVALRDGRRASRSHPTPPEGGEA